MKFLKRVINKCLRIIYKNNKEKSISLQFENVMGHKLDLDNPREDGKVCISFDEDEEEEE